MISLTNKTKRIKTYVLPHELYCKALGRCVCTTYIGGTKPRTSSSITIVSGTTVSGLPQEVLQLPKIAQAIKQGELRVQRTPKKEKIKNSEKPKTKRRKKPEAMPPKVEAEGSEK